MSGNRSVLRAAPWRRAPRLLWHFPVVWWALAGVGVVLALVVAVPRMYLSSAAGASVAEQERGRCPSAAGLQASGSEQLATDVRPDAPAIRIAGSLLGTPAIAVRDANGKRGHLGDTVVSLLGGTVDVLPAPGHPYSEPETLIYRDGALSNVDVTGLVAGEGFLLTDGEARTLDARPGGDILLQAPSGAPIRVRVVGTYRDLAQQPPRRFWCSLDRVIRLQDPFSNNVPPPVLLATSPAPMVTLLRQLRPDRTIRAFVERPLQLGLRLDQAEAALAEAKHARASERVDPQRVLSDAVLRTELPFVVTRAKAVRDALAPPLVTLAAIAGLAALGLMALAASFWADRRRVELDVLSVRGVGPFAMALKAVLECLVPLLVGAATGAGLAVLTVLAVGPDGGIAPGEIRESVVDVLLALPAASMALATTVVIRRRERTPVRRGRFAAPLTVLLVGATAAAAAAMGGLGRQPASSNGSLPTFGVARLLLPLVLLVLMVLLVVRLLTVLLPLALNRGEHLPVAVLLPTQRLAAAPWAAASLVLAVAVATGTCVYATGLSGSLQRTVEAKAEVFVGSDASVELLGQQPLPRDLPRLTPVLRVPDVTVDGDSVQLLAVDPASFTRGAFWQAAFADRSIATLMRQLQTPSARGIPALAVGPLPAGGQAEIAHNADPIAVPFAVTARPSAFPGMNGNRLLIVSGTLLRSRHPLTLQFATEQLWLTAPTAPALARLRQSHVQARGVTTAASVSATPALEAVLETLRILRALGVLVALLAMVGLAVYVDLRARRRRLAAVLTRRMGLRTRTEWLATWLELVSATGTGLVVGTAAGIALSVVGVPLLDPLPAEPPALLVALPTGMAVTLAAVAVVMTGLVAAPGRSRPDGAVLRAE